MSSDSTRRRSALLPDMSDNVQGGPTGCGHAQGLCQSLTAAAPGGNGAQAYSGGISADMVIAQAVNANAADPLTLYAGGKNYIAERISFKAGGAGQVRAADVSPYKLYSKLVGLTTTTGGGTTVASRAPRGRP